MASEWNWKRGEECEHCGNQEGPFRETFHGMTICVDSEQCAKQWQRNTERAGR